MQSRQEIAPEQPLRAARDLYLGENGFVLADYVADTVTIRAFGHDFTLPNRPNRKWAIPLHDLHHVATGYGTDLVGEAEIGAWELGAGCERPVVYALNIAATLIGIVLAPRRVLDAYRAGRAQRALYRTPHDYGALLEGTVGDLRALLGIPARGVARLPRKLHEAAPEGRESIDLPV